MTFNEFDPSEDDFRKLRQHYYDLWQKPRQTWEVVQNYIEQTFAVWSDREKQASRTNYRSPRANNIINHAVNAQTAYAPRTHREPLGSGTNQRFSEPLCGSWGPVTRSARPPGASRCVLRP